ncbi:DNA mismatch repair protein MutS-like isoform X2 [Corticium candelabrum]|nr:DNA mismatch repair protein MutS-like isoform X2 [Corticium candelabrum]
MATSPAKSRNLDLGLAHTRAHLRSATVNEMPNDWFASRCMNTFSPLHTNMSELECQAANILVEYVRYTQREHIPPLLTPCQYASQEHMAIDASARRSLELTRSLGEGTKRGSLLGCIDKTVSAAGRRLLQQRLSAPLLSVDLIRNRLDVVQFFYENPHLATETRSILKTCPDIERILQKISLRRGNEIELNLLYFSMAVGDQLCEMLLTDMLGEPDVRLIPHLTGLQPIEPLLSELERSVKDAGDEKKLMSGYCSEIDDLRMKIVENEMSVDKLALDYRALSGLSRLAIVSHKAYLRVIELGHRTASEFLSKMPTECAAIRVDQTSSKIRFSTTQLQELNNCWQQFNDSLQQCEQAAVESLCNQVTEVATAIRRLASSLAELDVASSLAILAHERGYTRPEVTAGTEFDVQCGVHPIVDVMQEDSSVGNDCNLTSNQMWIITGPNMGGKSTFLRQNALIAILAQIGSFVPAQSARIGVVDRLFARVGASDNLANYQSTFMTEMVETATILSQATARSLVILDEIGRGTSTTDGLAIAWSVLEHLHNITQCRTLSATHYSELGQLVSVLSHAACYQVTANRNSSGIQFAYRVVPGLCSQSFGVDVAHLAGVPHSVTDRAKVILEHLVSVQPKDVLKNLLI